MLLFNGNHNPFAAVGAKSRYSPLSHQSLWISIRRSSLHPCKWRP